MSNVVLVVKVPDSIAERAIGWLSQKWCGLNGHNEVLHFEGNRMMMRCTTCSHDSPGWETGINRPRRRYEGDGRHAVKRHAA